jgi:hypothetical protein
MAKNKNPEFPKNPLEIPIKTRKKELSPEKSMLVKGQCFVYREMYEAKKILGKLEAEKKITTDECLLFCRFLNMGINRVVFDNVMVFEVCPEIALHEADLS